MAYFFDYQHFVIILLYIYFFNSQFILSMINLISGKKLKLLLKRRRISSIEISNVLNISQSQVSRYLTDEVSMPATFVIRVAAYAKLKIEDLTEGYTEPHTIDIPHTEVAAEPPAPCIAAAEPPPVYQSRKAPDTVPAPSPLVTIDVSALDIIIHELRTKLTVMEHEVSKIKQELELVHQ